MKTLELSLRLGQGGWGWLSCSWQRPAKGVASVAQISGTVPGQETGKLFLGLLQNTPDFGTRGDGRGPQTKESQTLQHPPPPQPLCGFWEIPEGGVIPLIPEKPSLAAQCPEC